MAGEIIHFRKRFIGGFNRDDVVAYISKVSTARNEAIEANEESQAKIEKLNELISENCMKREETERELDKLRLELIQLRNQVESYKLKEQECHTPTPEPVSVYDEPALEPVPEPDSEDEPVPVYDEPVSEHEHFSEDEPALEPVPEPDSEHEPESEVSEQEYKKEKPSVLKIKLTRRRRD